jgi:hypothetical protein
LKTEILCAPQAQPQKYLFVLIATGILALGLPAKSFAVLGGSEASVQTDQVHMQASLQRTNAGAYTVHELHAPTGTVVREYVAGGTVFAVAWQGPWPPDLQQLLGSYFDSYQQARQAQSGSRLGRRPIHVEIPGLVVNVAGHPRSFTGQAFVPDMLPQGISAKEIR